MNLKQLEELGTCEDAVKIYKTRQEANPVTVLRLLIDGCDELNSVDLSERLEWGNWLIVQLLSAKDKVRYAIYAAEQVIDIFEIKCPEDQRPREAIEMAVKWLEGKATTKKAFNAADAAYYAAFGAFYAATTAAHAAYYAAHAAATTAAHAAYYAADAATYAADAADDYNGMLIKILENGIELLKGTEHGKGS